MTFEPHFKHVVPPKKLLFTQSSQIVLQFGHVYLWKVEKLKKRSLFTSPQFLQIKSLFAISKY